MTTEKRTVAPDMNWLAKGEEDPHPTYVNQTRENLALADYSDDELANAVFMSGDISREEDTARLIAAHKVGARYISKIALLTAAKERIRWLTRRLAVAEGRYPGVSKPATDVDSDISSSPDYDLYFHNDRSPYGLGRITKDQLTESYLDDLQNLGLLAPESRSAAKSLLQVPLKDSQYGDFQRWKKNLDNPELHAGPGPILGFSRDKTIIVSGHTARELNHFNGFDPLSRDHEGDSMLPKQFSSRVVSTPRKNMFANTALGKLLARALPNRSQGETEVYPLTVRHVARLEEALRKEEVLGFGPIEYYPIKLPDESPLLRHNPNRLTGESEMTTENDRRNAGAGNLAELFSEVEHLEGKDVNTGYGFDPSKFTQTQEPGGRGVAVPVKEEPSAPKMINFGEEGDYPDLNPEWTQWFMQLHSLPVLAAKSAAVNVFSNTLTMVRGRFNENKGFSADEKQLLEGLGFVDEGRYAFIIETLDDIIQDIQINCGL